MLEGVKNISAIQPLWLKIQTPERTFAGRYLLCTVSNSTSVGGIFRFKRDLVSFNDGLFELVLIKAPKDLIELGILAADLLVSNEKTPLMPDSACIRGDHHLSHAARLDAGRRKRRQAPTGIRQKSRRRRQNCEK